MVIDSISKEFRSELNAIGSKLRDKWVKKTGAGAQAILNEYNKITGR